MAGMVAIYKKPADVAAFEKHSTLGKSEPIASGYCRRT
jgi:hypothetical protein